MAMSRGILSTDPQYKEFIYKTNEGRKLPAAKREERSYHELTLTEKIKVDKILERYNAEQRKNHKIPAGHEYR